MATIDYKQLATPEANLIELLAAQNQDGTYSAKLMGSEPFAVLAAKTIYNAYNDIEDNMAADVEGPASSTDNALARFDGTTGKLLQNSNAILTDAGALSLASNLTLSGATSTITLGSTNTGSIAVDANGALIVTPKAGQYTTLSVSGNSGLFVNNGTTQIYLGNSGGSAVAGTLNANDFLLIRDGAVKLTATATGVDIAGNLTVSGTGTSSFGGTIRAGAGSGETLGAGSVDVAADLGIKSTQGIVQGGARIVAFTNGNTLLGTGTDSGNGKLQLATHTTSAGGIGFGTDTALFRENTGQLTLSGANPRFNVSASTATNPALSQFLNSGGTVYCGADGSGAAFGAGAYTAIFGAGSQATAIISGGVKAAVFDTSQNATFAGNVAIQSGNSLRLNNPANSAYASLRLDASNIVQANYDWTFAGAIAIGNTVQTAASVASTHKVTISIGGTTYYLLATNV